MKNYTATSCFGSTATAVRSREGSLCSPCLWWWSCLSLSCLSLSFLSFLSLSFSFFSRFSPEGLPEESWCFEKNKNKMWGLEINRHNVVWHEYNFLIPSSPLPANRRKINNKTQFHSHYENRRQPPCIGGVAAITQKIVKFANIYTGKTMASHENTTIALLIPLHRVWRVCRQFIRRTQEPVGVREQINLSSFTLRGQWAS